MRGARVQAWRGDLARGGVSYEIRLISSERHPSSRPCASTGSARPPPRRALPVPPERINRISYQTLMQRYFISR